MSTKPIHYDTVQALWKARNRIEKDFQKELLLFDLSQEAFLSPYHFIRQFRALFGTTPRQLRIRKRLQYAAALIRQGKTPTEACKLSGFHSFGTFSSRFARHFGKPPSVYADKSCKQLQSNDPKSGPTDPGHPFIPGCFRNMHRMGKCQL